VSPQAAGTGDIVMYMSGAGSYNDMPAIIMATRWLEGEWVADLMVFCHNGPIEQLGVKRFVMPPPPAAQWRDPQQTNQWFVKGDW
jgi:hypothetical protein